MKQPTQYDLDRVEKALRLMEDASRTDSKVHIANAAWELYKHAAWMRTYLKSQLEENARQPGPFQLN